MTGIRDRADIRSSRERTPEGYLRAHANIARVGVLRYSRDELQIADPDLPHTIGIYRPRDMLGSRETLESLRLKPVTDDHPPGNVDVNADNYNMYARGHVGDARLTREGMLQVDLIITDRGLIDRVERGTEEVSAGTTFLNLERTDGVWNGEPYHFVARAIDINHVAVVERGRAGREVKILDQGSQPMQPTDLQAITAAVAAAVRDALKDVARKPDSEAPPLTAESIAGALDKVLEVRDEKRKKAEDAEKAEREKADKGRDSVIDAANARAEILTGVKTIMKDADFAKVKDKSNTEIMREALRPVLNEAVDKMEEGALKGAFDLVMKERESAKGRDDGLQGWDADTGSGDGDGWGMPSALTVTSTDTYRKLRDRKRGRE